MDVVRNHDRSETSQEITRLRIDNATLRAENDGLKRLLSEREKVVALREQSSRREPFWRWWLHQKEAKQPANESSYEREMAQGQRELRRLSERVLGRVEEQFLWNAREAVRLTGVAARAHALKS